MVKKRTMLPSKALQFRKHELKLWFERIRTTAKAFKHQKPGPVPGKQRQILFRIHFSQEIIYIHLVTEERHTHTYAHGRNPMSGGATRSGTRKMEAWCNSSNQEHGSHD